MLIEIAFLALVHHLLKEVGRCGIGINGIFLQLCQLRCFGNGIIQVPQLIYEATLQCLLTSPYAPLPNSIHAILGDATSLSHTTDEEVVATFYLCLH